MVPSRERILNAHEVAQLFRVDYRTVTRWARQGRLPCVRTPGGQLRFRESDVRTYLREQGLPDDEYIS